MRFTFYFLAFCFLRSQVYAQVETRGSFSNLSSKESVQAPEIQFGFESYTSSHRAAYSESGYSSNALITGRIHQSGHIRNSYFYKVDSAVLYSSGEEWAYPKLRDAYIEKYNVKAGFVFEEWSAFEDEWRLGLFNPRFMYNKLSAGQGGVPGIHYKNEGFRFSLLPVFIPEFGPQVREQDGSLVSQNPWFGEVPETLTYNESEAPIRYNINMPSVNSVVFNPGLMTSYDTGVTKNWHSRVSGAYKPMPQILLNFPADGRFILGTTDQYFNVEVEPVVGYHAVASMDHFFNLNQTSRVKASLAHEVPVLPNRPETWVTQELGPATYLSSRIEQDFEFLDFTKIYFSQFKVWGGDQPDQGRFASENTFFETRQFFKEAYGLGIETQWNLGTPVLSEVSFIYDVLQEGAVFQTTHQLILGKYFRAFGTLELLGLTGSNDPYPAGFLSRYRANDRAELGVSYVF